MICIFTHGYPFPSGGIYRNLKSIAGFPPDQYRLYIPQDIKSELADKIKNLYNEPNISSLVLKAEETKPIKPCIGRWRCFVKYGEALAYQLKNDGCKLLYFPHELLYIPLGFKKYLPWIILLQLTPVIGSLVIENGSGFRLFWKNMKAIHNAPVWKILKAYIRLKMYGKLLKTGYTLAVSKSIPYELRKLGLKVRVEVLTPSVGVDPCIYTLPRIKDIDIIFFSRLIPQKGIYDYLKIVKKLQDANPNIVAVAVGSTDDYNFKNIKSYVNKLGVRIEILRDVKKEEAFQMLSRSKVAVYPSKTDAFPLVVLEALSCGTPVVAYDIPAIRYNFDTNAVVKTPVNDLEYMAKAVQGALAHHDMLSTLAMEFAKNFTWEKVSQTEWKTIKAIETGYKAGSDK
jgi:glycosyltransferase involved in cell wall biosynthesis